jgi:hypothetical protein
MNWKANYACKIVKCGKQAYVQDYSSQNSRECENPEQAGSPTHSNMSRVEELAGNWEGNIAGRYGQKRLHSTRPSIRIKRRGCQKKNKIWKKR